MVAAKGIIIPLEELLTEDHKQDEDLVYSLLNYSPNKEVVDWLGMMHTKGYTVIIQAERMYTLDDENQLIDVLDQRCVFFDYIYTSEDVEAELSDKESYDVVITRQLLMVYPKGTPYTHDIDFLSPIKSVNNPFRKEEELYWIPDFSYLQDLCHCPVLTVRFK